jgi:hypothetical protein
VPGLHVFCGEGPLKFYQKSGFEILGEALFKKKPVFVLARGA